MSTCISRHGEYSDHVWDDAGIDCTRCGYETSAREWLERHPQALRDAVVEAARSAYDDLLLADGEGMDREAWTDLAADKLERALAALDAATSGDAGRA